MPSPWFVLVIVLCIELRDSIGLDIMKRTPEDILIGKVLTDKEDTRILEVAVLVVDKIRAFMERDESVSNCPVCVTSEERDAESVLRSIELRRGACIELALTDEELTRPFAFVLRAVISGALTRPVLMKLTVMLSALYVLTLAANVMTEKDDSDVASILIVETSLTNIELVT